MDTHPMVQSNDTLTDCLNGTLITMNGNEVILQNDMGNRRVDKAFLPPGYEPVGMKEYGGVIYVAAYNPITNKSQIGSFPSPQKKLSSTNNGDLEGSFNFDDFFTNYNCDTDPDLRISIINSDSFIIPLTKNINLRAGDKFAVYSNRLSEISNLLTNYDNTSGSNKAYSPKNRRFTLQLGVLNSQNEFVDITKTLCRWKNQNGTWSPVVYNEEKSDIFKFNDGYFISDSFTSQFNVDTIADAQLIKERQKIAANTYSYKLVGPLYLKTTLNHIQNFNYNIYGLYDKDVGFATLWIEGFLTYNCPDGAPGLVNNPNGDYATFEEGKPADNFGFDLFGFTSSNQVSMKTPSNYNVDRDKCVYNPNTNTYTVKIVRKYENITANSSGKYFNYVIGVKADKDYSVYLKGLSVKGSIDLTLLGSNQVKYSSWRFYNNQGEGSTLLTFAFEAYPEYGKSFGNLRFKFHNVLHGNNHDQDFYYPHDGGDLPMYNGRQTISFNWEENEFEERKIYEVTTEYNIIDNKTKQIVNNTTNNVPLIVNEKNSRWLLTTELFNKFYNQPIKTPDYCNVPDDEDDTHKEFYNKMKIKYGNSSSIVDNTQLHHKVEEGSSLISSGGLDTTSIGNPIRFIYNNIYNLQVSTNVKLSINNENLYPDFIHINDNEEDNYIQINDVNVIQLGDKESPVADSNSFISTKEGKEAKYDNIFKTNLNTISGLSVSDDVLQKLEKEEKLSIKFNYNKSKNLTGYVQYNDIYVGKGEPIQNIGNAFDNFSTLLEMGYGYPGQGEYTGIVMNYDIHHDDEPGMYWDWNDVRHDDAEGTTGNIFVEVIKNNYNDTINDLPDHDDTFENGERVYERGEIISFSNDIDNRHKTSTINFTEIQDGIFQAFNDAVENKNLIFLYIYADPNKYFTFNKLFAPLSTSGILGQPSMNGDRGTKVWWKMPGGQWAVFEELLTPPLSGETKNQRFSRFVKDSIGTDIIYCMYDRYSGNAGLYAADENYAYYGRYSVPITIKINYGFSPETTEQERNDLIDNIVNIDYNNPIGNLQFSREHTPEFGFDILELTLDSSLKFHDTINSFDTSDIKNVYIKGGKNVDSSGEPLNPNYVYYFDEKEGNLVRILDNPFMVDSVNKIEGRNVLLYNFNSSKSSLFASLSSLVTEYNIQIAQGTDLYSILYYDNPNNIVKKLYSVPTELTPVEDITS